MKWLKRLVGCILAAIVSISAATEAYAGLVRFTAGEALPSYREYQGPPSAIASFHESYASITHEGSYTHGYEGFNGPVAIIREGESGTWQAELPQSGGYHISILYFPLQGRGEEILTRIIINGEASFQESERIVLHRQYEDAVGIIQNARGDDIKPAQREVFEWREQVLRDFSGFIRAPYLFSFEAGANEITLDAISGGIAVAAVKIFRGPPLPSYAEYIQAHPITNVPIETLLLQAEAPHRKSSMSLSPSVDRSSSATMPNSPIARRLNMIGAANWSISGQWLSWNFEVPEAGHYQIALRWKQDTISGYTSTRRIYINGEVPFLEMEAVNFPFSSGWQVTSLGNPGDPFLFYLEKGEHVITLEATTGDLAEIINRVNESLYTLNRIYRQIAQLTGVVPDLNRDYEMEMYIPNTLQDLVAQQYVLQGILDDLIIINNGSGEIVAEIQRTLTQVRAMNRRIESIPKRLADYKNCLAGMADWLNKAMSQPMSLDYIAVMPVNARAPRANNNFFVNLWFEIRMFFASFTRNANQFDEASPDGENRAITVWLQSVPAGLNMAGRDQAQLMAGMFENEFTPETGIDINFQLIPPGSLLQATFAGIGPDVFLQMAAGDTVNYGLRNAIMDISGFAGFDEVYGRFTPAIWVPYTFDGKVYGIPETQNFPILFYRRDILEQELGYSITGQLTWDDLMRIMPDILNKNMEVWIPPNTSMFYSILKQYGGDFFRDDYHEAALDTQAAFNAFRFFTDLYTAYKQPILLNFVNRFRTGQSPIGIEDFMLANTLSVAAPEISGLWGFAPIPGILVDGEINHTGYLISSGCIMLADTGQPDASWEFMRWWTSADAQTQYGLGIENVLGPAGRYNTANLEAFSQLPWPTEFYETLQTQMDASRSRREVPGGYYVDRLINFAIRNVIIDEKNPHEALLDSMIKINEEISYKAEELGIPLEMGASLR